MNESRRSGSPRLRTTWKSGSRRAAWEEISAGQGFDIAVLGKEFEIESREGGLVAVLRRMLPPGGPRPPERLAALPAEGPEDAFEEVWVQGGELLSALSELHSWR